MGFFSPKHSFLWDALNFPFSFLFFHDLTNLKILTKSILIQHGKFQDKSLEKIVLKNGLERKKKERLGFYMLGIKTKNKYNLEFAH